MKSFRYFKLQIKRVLEISKKSVFISLVFLICIVFLGLIVIKKSNISNRENKFSIGLVCSQDNEILNLCINILNNMDKSNFVIEFETFSSEMKAKEALLDEQIIAFAVIPDEFVESLYYLQNPSPITYYSNYGESGILKVVMDEVAKYASNIITYTQTGLFTLEEILDENIISIGEQNKEINILFSNYIQAIILRDNLIQTQELGYYNGISFSAYYLCSFILIYIFLLAFSGISFFIGQKNEFLRMVNAAGICPMEQIFCEFVGVCIMNVFSWLVLVLVGTALIGNGFILREEFSEMLKTVKISQFLAFCIKLLPVLVFFASFELFLMNCFEDIIGKCLFTSLIFIVFSFFSGYFYPQTFLPQKLTEIGKILPTGTALSYTASVFNGTMGTAFPGTMGTAFPLFFMLIYSVIFLFLTVFIRKIRINGGNK